MCNEDIIIAPILSEKATALREEGKYVFKVDRRANKPQISAAVSALFNVKVEKVTVMNVFGKIKRLRTREGRTPSWKKAIVKLAEGQTISTFEGV
ncbi:MAG: 50S ribosomal protein L23 [Spirochaetaceae bacterium]|jgi:large subunit ribosomal protein L23|nr:50S ribosomal protein L23 [Spirochaetaceae bacterium]